MKSPYVRELQENSSPSISVRVQSKEVRQKKTGEPYLSLILSDKTGDIEGKMWDNVADIIDTFDRDDFIRVKGLVQVYHNRVQLVIHRLRPMQDREIDFADFFPSSQYDPALMWDEVRGHVNAVGNPHVRALLNAVLDDEEIARRFRIAPAAKQIHHAFLSGLLEHVVSLCHLSKTVGPLYPFIDCDLLIAGAVLHDLGKIYELGYERGFSYTVEGQLLGHMTIGLRIVSDKLRGLPDFPPQLRNLIEHIIISHHGQLEFGSPKVPQYPEALMFHFLDDLDSKMECSRSLLERDRTPGHFTSFSQALDRGLLKKAAYLAGASPAKPECWRQEPETDQQALPATAPATAPPTVHNGPPHPVHPAPGRPTPVLPQPANSLQQSPPPHKPDSFFGAKLLEALRPEK
jgi:3'-5' exoribonuclease